ncbi:MAG: GtrA family protein [Labedaea sp.]
MRLGRIVRFSVVGVFNTGTYYLLYLLFNQFIPYLLAHAVAAVLSMTGSYFLNCYVTFRARPTLRKFLLFPLSNLFNYAVTTVGLYVLVGLFHVNETTSPLIAASVAIPVTFLMAQQILADQPEQPARTGAAQQEPEGCG